MKRNPPSPGVSLLDRAMARFGAGRIVTGAAAGGGRIAPLAILLAAAVLAGTALWAAIEARRAWAETAGLATRAAEAARLRDHRTALARALAIAPLDDRLARLGPHLPPDARLAEAARSEDGALAIAIDTTDPDALRIGLRGDPALAGFREIGQAARDDGTLRVRLREAAR